MSTDTRVSAVLALALLLVTGVTIGAAPVAADSSDTALGGVLDSPTDNPGAVLSAVWSGLGGARERTAFWAKNRVGMGDDETDAASQASAVTTYWNNHNGTLEAYANERDNYTEDHTVEVVWHLNDETATRYLLVNSTDGNATTKMVQTTTRTPDHDLELCGYAAASSHEEIQTFTEDFAEPNKDVTASYLGRVKGAYGDDVETSLFQSSGDCGGDA